MAKYIDADRLRAEIEKRKQIHFNDYFVKKSGNPADYGASNALAQVLPLIDSLQQEQPSIPSNLDEAARKAALMPELVGVDEEHLDEYPYSPIAEQKFKEGAKWDREQMMSEAVEGEITKDYRGNNVVRAGVFNKDFEYGDKVRVIVLPKED